MQRHQQLTTHNSVMLVLCCYAASYYLFIGGKNHHLHQHVPHYLTTQRHHWCHSWTTQRHTLQVIQVKPHTVPTCTCTCVLTAVHTLILCRHHFLVHTCLLTFKYLHTHDVVTCSLIIGSLPCQTKWLPEILMLWVNIKVERSQNEYMYAACVWCEVVFHQFYCSACWNVSFIHVWLQLFYIVLFCELDSPKKKRSGHKELHRETRRERRCNLLWSLLRCMHDLHIKLFFIHFVFVYVCVL